MIRFSEVVAGPIPKKHQDNVLLLLDKINLLRTAYGKRLRVSSGYRSMTKHLAIYKSKGITDKSKIPMQSNHLVGLAVDLVPLDEDIKEFQKWILENVKLMEQIGLWFEHFDFTPTWVHAQCVPPKSGNRFFIPFTK